MPKDSDMSGNDKAGHSSSDVTDEAKAFVEWLETVPPGPEGEALVLREVARRARERESRR